MSDDTLQQEVLKLRKDVNNLTQIVVALIKARRAEAKQMPVSLLERATEEFKAIQAKRAANSKVINTFKIDDVVEMVEPRPDKTNGIVKYVACKHALPSVKKCDKKTCSHDPKPFVWVCWPKGKTFSYHHSELIAIPKNRLNPHIGKELSGKIGPWEFNAKTKLWKKNGDSKEYTEEEFMDIVYWDLYPDAKEEGADFIKNLMAIKPTEIK